MLKEFIKDESAAKKITADDLAVFINAYLVSDTLDTLAPALEGDFTNPPRVANYTISKIYSVIFAHSKHVGKDTDEMQDWIDNILCDSSMSTKEKAKVLYDEENASALTPEEEKYIKDTYNALENIRMAAKILTGSERLSLRIEAPIKALRRFINTEARIPTKFDALFNVIKPMQKKLEAGSLSKGERTVRDGGIMSLWGEILPMVRGLIAKTENTPSRKADMEQECFEAFLKNLWDYEPGIGSPRTYFKPYFARIIHINTAL